MHKNLEKSIDLTFETFFKMKKKKKKKKKQQQQLQQVVGRYLGSSRRRRRMRTASLFRFHLHLCFSVSSSIQIYSQSVAMSSIIKQSKLPLSHNVTIIAGKIFLTASLQAFCQYNFSILFVQRHSNVFRVRVLFVQGLMNQC